MHIFSAYGQNLNYTEPLSRYGKNIPTEITGLSRDRQGFVWFSTRVGIYAFNGNKANFEPSLGNQEYLGVMQSNTDEMLFFQKGKVVSFHPVFKTIRTAAMQDFANIEDKSILFEKGFGDTIYAIQGGNCGVFIHSKNSFRWIKTYHSSGLFAIEYDQNIAYLVEVRHANATHRFKLLFTLENSHSHVFSSNSIALNNFEELNFNALPVNRTLLFSSKTLKDLRPTVQNSLLGTFLWYDSIDVLVNPLDQKLRAVLLDNWGYKWILTNSQLYISYPRRVNFSLLFPHKSTRDFVPLADGNKLAGINDQVVLMGPNNEVIQSFKFRLYGLCVYTLDSIFLTSDDQFCGWYNVKKRELTKIQPPNSKIQFFHGAIQMGNGRLFVFGSEFQQYNVATGIFSKVKMGNSMELGMLRTGFKYSDSEVVLGGNQGLYLYNIHSQTMTQISKEFITHATIFQGNKIIAGTLSHGVKIYLKTGKEDQAISKWPFRDASSNVYNVLSFKNDIWAGTGNGLARFNVVDGKYKIYYERSGTGNVEYNSPGAREINDSTLWFAGLNGISEIHPKDLNFVGRAQKAFISSIRYFNKEWLVVKAVQRNNGNIVYKMPAGSNDFEFEAGIEDFVHKAYYEIRYQFGSDSSDWISAEPYQAVRISNLGVGTYKLTIKLIDLRTGNLAGNRVVTIYIEPFWYQTFGFKIILTMLILAFLVALFIWNGNRIKEKARRENELLKAEMKALAAQIDPHFLANLMSSAQLRLLQGTQSEALEILAEYGTLMRNKYESGQHEYTTVQAEADLLKNYLAVAGVVLGAGFQPQIHIALGKNLQDCVMPAGIVQPVVENAINHGWKKGNTEHKKLLISFIKTNHQLEITIQDNGGGVDTDTLKKRKSSLNNIEKRLALMSKMYHSQNYLQILSENRETTVKIIIDCEKNEAA